MSRALTETAVEKGKYETMTVVCSPDTSVNASSSNYACMHVHDM